MKVGKDNRTYNSKFSRDTEELMKFVNDPCRVCRDVINEIKCSVCSNRGLR